MESSSNLESESQAPAHAARGLHQVHGVAVRSDHRHIALRQQITNVKESFHVPGHSMESWQWLPDEQVEEWIGLPGGRIEHIDWKQALAARPAIGRNPLRLAARQCAVNLQ